MGNLAAFVPQVWDDVLLENLKKTLIYAGPSVVNHDYEGQIRDAGDSVKITSISRPTVSDYVPGGTINLQPIVAAGRTLLIDQAKVWGFKLDDIEQVQAAGNVMAAAMAESAYSVAEAIDIHVASLYTGAQASNVVAPVTIDHSVAEDGTEGTQQAQWTKVWDQILVPLGVKLDEANVPREGRYVIVPPWVHAALIRDNRFLQVDSSGTPEAMRNGMVGRANGFDILMSNNVPVPTANNYIITAGNNRAITLAQQLVKTEAFRPEADFSDAVKGLCVWGARVIRPDSLAYATATYKA